MWLRILCIKARIRSTFCTNPIRPPHFSGSHVTLKRSRQKSSARVQAKHLKQKKELFSHRIDLKLSRPLSTQGTLLTTVLSSPAFSGRSFTRACEIKLVLCVISSWNSNLPGDYVPPGNAILLLPRRGGRPGGRPWPSGVPPSC